jgi:DNA-binding XRE family transcriptional regulator
VDVTAIAAALADVLAPTLADAVADGVRRGRRPELAPVGVVGVGRVVDSLRAAFEAARVGGELPDREARARLDRAVIEAINVLAYGETASAPAGLEAASKGPPVADPRQIPLLPPEGVPVAAPPRIDAGKLRAAVPGAERRKGSAERREDAREEAPGRRLADELRTARDSRGLTQRAAASAAGVPLATYQRAEQGKDLRAENRDRLAAWAGVAAPGVSP